MKKFTTFVDGRGLIGEPTKIQVTVDFYAINDTPAIMLTTVPTDDKPYSELWGTASICLHDYELPDGYLFIKDHSENEGMVQMMIDAGVISGVVKREEGTPLCKLTDAFHAYIEQRRQEDDSIPYTER
jgi:hypothetical protein